MKKVVQTLPKAQIPVIEIEYCLLDDHIFYAARNTKNPRWGGLIHREGMSPTSKYKLYCVTDAFVKGNTWCVLECASFAIFLNNLILAGWDIRQCESLQEAAHWLEE
jgi:hypothetical protein